MVEVHHPSFPTKKNREAIGDFKGRMYPLHKFSSRNSSRTLCSLGESGYALQFWGMKSGLRSIACSQGWDPGKHSAAFFSNTVLYCRYFSGNISSKDNASLWVV